MQPNQQINQQPQKNKPKRNFIQGIQKGSRLSLLIVSAALLVACDHGDTTDLKAFVQETKDKYKPDVEPPPTIPNFVVFRYAAHDLRAPFIAAESEEMEVAENEIDGSSVRPDKYRRKEELEAFPLDALRMVGTLKQGEETQAWGLIKAPDGTIHRVKPGNYLGLNHGKILNVLDSGIDLMEIVPKPAGGWQEREATVALSGIDE